MSRCLRGFPTLTRATPLCERQIWVLKENVRIWCKTERTRDWVRLLPVISLMMNSQESSATGYVPHELLLGCLAWFLHAPYPEDTHSSVGEWVQEQQAKVDEAKAMLQRVRESVEQEEQASSTGHLPRGGLGASAPQTTTRLATLYQRLPILRALQDSICGWTPYSREVFSPSRGEPGVRCSTPEALL